ncbi:alpha/beta fold hydrolase [Mycobacterium xenopi]|uniref:Esterase n=2 Tax=Mycobacterium xenopi TaxID=1789 RepID=A0AAD1M2V2_MYCXE|nr:alpha/beta hydrolase [Mycobacterium xenopi]MDA3638461.1 alpha/beta hydrolase [Mycobacterium xenopi]MDA3656834.1 alpha/beta hydrolase [Mycobacterium xenopi]MDA3661456.1 alpha/beta hydrolase [Mycobacterium xenopi]ORX17554.1 esterase [Mycobacterium xenopi]SPX90626.1 alpha/beta hydrolase fold protein [Mycobacterium xenopi]
MALPALVLVHGGEHAADCWDFVVAELAEREPHLKVLAVDLPGRRDKPGDLRALDIGVAVESVVDDIHAADLSEVVIVGHSIAGVTVPGVAGALGSARVREMIFAACHIPPQGASILDAIGGPLSLFALYTTRTTKPFLMPKLVARLAFCNGMTREQREFMLSHRYRDSVRLYNDKVDRRTMPTEIPRTWILTRGDRILSQRAQRKSIAALGGVDTIIPVDSCHDLMISRPSWLADTLLQRCRRYEG